MARAGVRAQSCRLIAKFGLTPAASLVPPFIRNCPMSEQSPFRSTIEQMEEHEIIDRMKRGMFSDEARPIAEAILRERGIDSANPLIPDDPAMKSDAPKTYRPWVVPVIFAFVAATNAGRFIGAAIGGAIGAGLFAGVLALLGWWIGAKIAVRVRKFPSATARFVVLLLACIGWIFFCTAVGLLAQAVTGSVRA
jgi:hypothetical protein